MADAVRALSQSHGGGIVGEWRNRYIFVSLAQVVSLVRSLNEKARFESARGSFSYDVPAFLQKMKGIKMVEEWDRINKYVVIESFRSVEK